MKLSLSYSSDRKFTRFHRLKSSSLEEAKKEAKRFQKENKGYKIYDILRDIDDETKTAISMYINGKWCDQGAHTLSRNGNYRQ